MANRDQHVPVGSTPTDTIGPRPRARLSPRYVLVVLKWRKNRSIFKARRVFSFDIVQSDSFLCQPVDEHNREAFACESDHSRLATIILTVLAVLAVKNLPVVWMAYNPGRVIPRLARASLYVTASRKVQRTGLRVHPFFPKRCESSALADTTRPKKAHFYHSRTNLLAQSLRLFIFRQVWHAWGFEFSHHRSSRDFQQLAKATNTGNSGDVKWKNLGKTSNKRLSVTQCHPK